MNSSLYRSLWLHLTAFGTLALSFSASSARQMPRNPLPTAPLAAPLAALPQTHFKFDFGAGQPREGYISVAPDAIYSAERGYGFDFDSQPVRGERAGFVTSAAPPLFFSVKVPEGNYKITATLGDEQGASQTTIRTEAGHLMAAGISTAAGQVVTRTFVANVRRPQLPSPPPNAPGGSIVHMFLAGEAESRAWDDRLTIEFNGARPCLRALEIAKDDALPTVFMAGDSTVGDPRRGPGGNWPTQICQWFKPEIAVCNSAEGGETSKSFVTGLRMDKVLSQMKAGDFFLIQFGHNDSKPQWPQTYTEPGTTFNAYLRVFIAETRRRGAIPILVTPMERRDNGDSVGPWARAMREVAAQEKVALVDQWAMSKELWAAMGTRVGTAFSDQTHLNGYGGYLLSKIVALGIKRSVPELAKHLVDDFVTMEPTHPEAPPVYLQQSGVPRPA